MCFRLRRHSHSVRRYIFVIEFKEKSLFLDNLCMNVMKSLDFPGICGISQKHKFLACYSVHSQKNYYIMRYLYISPHKITMIKYTCGSTLLGSIVLIHFSMFRKKLKTKVIVFFSQSRTTTPYGAFVETPASSTTSSSSCWRDFIEIRQRANLREMRVSQCPTVKSGGWILQLSVLDKCSLTDKPPRWRICRWRRYKSQGYLDIGRGGPVRVSCLCSAPSAVRSRSRSSARPSRTPASPASASRWPRSDCPCRRSATAMGKTATRTFRCLAAQTDAS